MKTFTGGKNPYIHFNGTAEKAIELYESTLRAKTENILRYSEVPGMTAWSMEFFRQLGVEFNPKFTDDKAACMIVNQEAFVMLLTEPFFKTLTKREICNTITHTEGLVALSCESRAEVDEVVKKAVAAGGKHAMDPVDHGFIYTWSFYDVDGHHWEVLWMDPKAIPE